MYVAFWDTALSNPGVGGLYAGVSQELGDLLHTIFDKDTK